MNLHHEDTADAQVGFKKKQKCRMAPVSCRIMYLIVAQLFKAALIDRFVLTAWVTGVAHGVKST